MGKVIKALEKNVTQATALLDVVSDEEVHKPWSLLKTGETVFTMPKLAVIRTWVINHIVHRRGHLVHLFADERNSGSGALRPVGRTVTVHVQERAAS